MDALGVLERIAAADAAVREHYGTPAGSSLVISARFGLPPLAVRPLHEAEMWRRVVADRDAKRRIKLGLDEEDSPKATALRPSARHAAAGLRFHRAPAEDLCKDAARLREKAWDAGWEVTATRWIGMVPTRKRQGDPWVWHRETRVSLWFHVKHEHERWAVGHWTNGGWHAGFAWRRGEFRRPVGFRALGAVICDP